MGAYPTAYLLPDRERRGVLQMGTPDLGPKLELFATRIDSASSGTAIIAATGPRAPRLEEKVKSTRRFQTCAWHHGAYGMAL